MHCYFNGQIIPEKDVRIGITDRAFLYGDGLFESMKLCNSRIPLLEGHLSRLQKGMKALGLESNISLSAENIHKIVKHLWQVSGLSGDLRLKLIVWRVEGGLYLPQNRQSNLLLLISPFPAKPASPQRLGISERAQLCADSFSRFKTLSALPYVVAAQEAAAKKLDDLVLLDVGGHPAECVSSNLFWGKAGVVYTPSLKTGCVGGVFRAAFIKILKKNGIAVEKGLFGLNELLYADFVFKTNMTGLSAVESIGERRFGAVPQVILGLAEKMC